MPYRINATRVIVAFGALKSGTVFYGHANIVAGESWVKIDDATGRHARTGVIDTFTPDTGVWVDRLGSLLATMPGGTL